MLNIVFVAVLVAQQAFAVDTNTTSCGLNEIYLECGPRCPQNCDVRASECKAIDVCDKGCYCMAGYVRYKGVCRDEKQICCPNNEIFSCGSACQNECSKLGQVCPIQTLVCVENCFCIDGYARDSNGKCIPESKCPIKGVPTCEKPNEHYDKCAAKYEPSCANRDPYGCDISECDAKCVCNDEYIRDENGNCVKVDECDSSIDADQVCTRNAVYDTCGNTCQGTCDDPNRPLYCKMPCQPGCFCKDGFLFNEYNNKCVKPENCY